MTCVITSVLLFAIWSAVVITARLQSLSDIKPALCAERIIANGNASIVFVRIFNNGHTARIHRIEAIGENIEIAEQSLPREICCGKSFVVPLLYGNADGNQPCENICLRIRYSDIEHNTYTRKIVCPTANNG